jgi:hypothetical protein
LSRSAHQFLPILLGALMPWALPLSASAVAGSSASHSQQGLEARVSDAGMKGDKDADTREDKRAGSTLEPQWQHDPIRFTARDREAIRTYYRGAASPFPAATDAGNANARHDLSAAARKRLQRNGKLPRGLQKRLEPLADDVERRLRVLPRGYSRAVIGHDVLDVLIVENRTQRIIDIIRDVTGRR